MCPEQSYLSTVGWAWGTDLFDDIVRGSGEAAQRDRLTSLTHGVRVTVPLSSESVSSPSMKAGEATG